MASRLSNDDFKALAHLRLQLRRYLRFSEEAARRAGMEPQQHQVLLALKGLPKDQQPTIGEIAHRMQLRHHSAVELVDRMVERRLLKRGRSSQDGRVVLLSITAKGERLLHELTVEHRDELRSRGPGLIDALRSLVHAKVQRA